MIRRPDSDSFLLITQHDHALLAGQFAREIGNALFHPPSPLGPTLQAIDIHDAGWPAHDDDRPTLNKHHLPLHIFETPFPLSIRAWSAAVDKACELGPYQGLLVSLHVLGLSAISLTHALNPSRTDVFEINKFQHKQIEIQDRLRALLGLATDVPLTLGLADPGTSAADDLLLFNFRLLTAMDRISLALCCGENLFSAIDDIRPRPGSDRIRLSLTMPNPATMTLDPWPFAAERIDATIPARRITNRPFDDDEAFLLAYRESPVEQLPLTLRRA